MDVNSSKGSLWRIWDMHVHTPASYGGSYETFIQNAKNSSASVIGLNDYCTIAGYEEVANMGGIPNKVIFPVVELRMNNLLHTKKKPNGIKINFHIIFDNDPTIFHKIKIFLASLRCFDEKGNNAQLGTIEDVTKVSFGFDDVIEDLKKYELFDAHALIWLPYDEYGGIDEIDPNTDGYFKLSLINKAHVIGTSTKKQIDFFKWLDPKYNETQYEEWFEMPKPSIKGSDAHKIDYPFGCLQNHLSQPIDRFCWIKADMTFEGLKQIIIEPERVFIGEEPELIKRVKANKTKFIKSLEIKKLAGIAIDDVWFKNFNIELNSGLVAIIGNKGGGKSAITDILSLCGNTHQSSNDFSFLTGSKFRKPKPVNLSEKFEAVLTWEDETPVRKALNENPDKNLPERVKYVPQNFLETLCSNVESDAFERELKQIIYSHTPNDKRFGKSSLDELINYKSGLVTDDISQIQVELSKINTKIVELENKATDEYKKIVENNLKLKQGELFSHDSNKPVVPVIGQESEESQKIVAELTLLREQIKTIELEIAILQKRKADLALTREELNRAIQFYKGVDQQLAKYKDPQNEYVQILSKNKINISDVFTYEVNLSAIEDLVTNLSIQITEVDESLNSNTETSKVTQLAKLNEKLLKDQDELDKPAKARQKYLDDIKLWETKKLEIEGNKETEGTLSFYSNQLDYLKNRLLPELAEKYNERGNLAKNLYDRKLSLVEIRKELFQPVTQYINDFKELKERYDVKIDVSLELKSFADNFFAFVGQNRIGTYNGKEEGYRRIQELIDKTQFTTNEDFIQFTNDLINSLKFDQRTPAKIPVNINSQLRKDIEPSRLYDFIFGADYLQPTYNLKLGNKTLQELSPGERGALLLIFYLILDNDDIPLIIDQPEENLDNESVYYILVHFIKKVKETRQIIIVTHNPNLAVVCDADQIIHMHIEKENKNTITYLSGAIENIAVNKSIINILEGTLPAFNNRQSKYFKNRIKLLNTLLTKAEQSSPISAVELSESEDKSILN
jgi:ABC-type lipoprotein export system ATPase subunit